MIITNRNLKDISNSKLKGILAGGIKIILKGYFRREFQDANLKGHFDGGIRAEWPVGITLGE